MVNALNTDAASAGFRPHLASGRSRAAVAGVFWSGLHTLVPTLSATVLFFVAAWYLGPADFGLVGLATGIVSVALAFSPAAFGEALVQRQRLDRSHADTVFALTVGYGLVAAGLLAFTAPWIAASVAEPELAAMLIVLALRVPLDMAASVPSALIVRDMQFRAVAIRTGVATVIASLLSLAMLIQGFGVWALVVGQLTSALVIAGMAFWVAKWVPGRAVTRAALRDLLSYGIFSSGNRMLNVLRLDHIVLGALGGAQVLGLYVFAQKIFRMLSDVVSGALSSVSHALLSTLQDDKDKLRGAFGLASFASAAVGFPVFAGMALIIDDLIGLALSADWFEVRFAAQLFCLVGLMAAVSIVQGSLIKAAGRADWWFWYQLAQNLTTVLMIPVFWQSGIDVLVIAIAVKTLLVWPISIWMTTKILDLSTLTYLRAFAAPAVATLAMAGAILAIDIPASWSGVALQVALGGIVYSGVLAFGAKARISELRQILKNKGVTR